MASQPSGTPGGVSLPRGSPYRGGQAARQPLQAAPVSPGAPVTQGGQGIRPAEGHVVAGDQSPTIYGLTLSCVSYKTGCIYEEGEEMYQRVVFRG